MYYIYHIISALLNKKKPIIYDDFLYFGLRNSSLSPSSLRYFSISIKAFDYVLGALFKFIF